METVISSTGHSATAGKRRQRKVRKLAGRGAVASNVDYKQLVSDPQPEDPDQMGIGGSEARDPSVYLAVNRGRWLSTRGCYYPLHKVEVASFSDDTSSPSAPASSSRVANMRTDVGAKTFVSVQSRWIVGVGGDPGGTAIFDTKTAAAIPGPKLVTPKLCPVVAAVGYRVYAHSATANFTEGPDYKPWFEVLDLSRAMDAEGNLSLLDRCSWEAMPSPPCFPCELPTAEDYLRPPMFTVTAYVVVGYYILLSVYDPWVRNMAHEFRFNSIESQLVTYAFDTRSGRWHKIEDTSLPFHGPATPIGHSGRVFLSLSRKNGPICAYRICVSTPSWSSTMAGVSDDKDGALKLSITVFSLKTNAHEQVFAGSGHYFASLDGTCFSTLFHSLDDRKCYRKFCKKTGEFYSRMLGAKLRTYQIESESLAPLETPDKEKRLSAKPQIVISSQREQAFSIFSAHGFYSPPIAFAASM